MKKFSIFILLLSLMYGCKGAIRTSENPADEAMNSLLISALDYNLSSMSHPFIVMAVENSSGQNIMNANFYLSLHKEGDEVSPNPFYLLPTEQRIDIPSGETVEVNFEISSGFLDENEVKEFEETGSVIAFVQADGYLGSIEKDNYYSFGKSIEYKVN